MSRYSNELKASVLRRMMPPENRTVLDLSQETGITQTTLYGWRRSARARGIAVPGNGEPAEQWSSAEKFRVVLETAHLTEVALAEYCRSRGLYVEQVGQWRHGCEQGNARAEEASQADRGALRQVRRRNLDLEKELRRKDKALAELAALLVLTKKLEAFRNNRENEDA
jgi:transposase-like protein